MSSMNRYPVWGYLFILGVTLLGVIYALPNLYGSAPAVQVSSSSSAGIGQLAELDVEIALEKIEIVPLSIELDDALVILRFANQETQLQARKALQKELGAEYVVALSLAPNTPFWLKYLAAEPMFLGLDLRGGVHFLMEVDMEAAAKTAEENYASDLRSTLRENKVGYKTVSDNTTGGLLVRYREPLEKTRGDALIADDFPDLVMLDVAQNDASVDTVWAMSESALKELQKNSLQQNITTLRKRVNELGVAEPIVQQQGSQRIVVQLPGVQDTTRAKEILGATATLELRLVDEEHTLEDALDGVVPPSSRLYRLRNGGQILLKKRLILTGHSIINAASGLDQLTADPEVSITLDGKGAKQMSVVSGDNVGKRMAVVFIETKTETVYAEDGTPSKKNSRTEEVINAATIQEQLGKRFRITGLNSPQEARDLALLLRAGALAAPIEIVEERTVGPSLGQDSIDQGLQSVLLGLVLVMIFIAVYYGVFGLLANVALSLNLVLLIALLSLLQATLTLPGIAGIVLTVGMAVDANVLIFERIREEIANGNSPQAAIHVGYAKAFATILDANVTTLIAALVLFSFGAGPIKGFAVTLSLGIICSMFTAVFVTRALVNLIYGGRTVNSLAV